MTPMMIQLDMVRPPSLSVGTTLLSDAHFFMTCFGQRRKRDSSVQRADRTETCQPDPGLSL
jgi:hypothetical protein